MTARSIDKRTDNILIGAGEVYLDIHEGGAATGERYLGDPTAAGNNLIAAAGRAEINLGREAGDAAGQIKNLAAVDFAPTALVENATHFAIMDAETGGNVRAWGCSLTTGATPSRSLNRPPTTSCACPPVR